MHVLRQQALGGPNLFTAEKAIRLTLKAAGEDLVAVSDASRRATERLAAVLPDDVSLWRSDGVTGSALSLACCIGHLALCLQEEFGDRLSHYEVLPVTPEGATGIVHACADPTLGLLAGRLAVSLTAAAAAAGDDRADLAAAFERSLARLRQAALLVSTRCSVWEAQRRGIPWARIAHSDGMVRLGQGHKQRRLRGGYLQETSFLASKLATAKAAAADLLRSGGIPVPDNRLVTEEAAAVAAAQEIGYPVVVKPNARDMGTAVSIGLADADAVRAAYKSAARYGQVLVERQVAGRDHRVSILHGRMIAAGRDIAAHVVGDGQSSIQSLIDDINRDPRRGLRDCIPLKKIRPDARILEALARQGHSLESVPAADETVALRFWWRHANDHSAEDVTARVHPENRAMLERAARLVGLDLAGIDFITPDITRPWFEVGGAINEINPTPGFRTHVRAGAPDVHRILIEALFPPGDDGRIPLAALVTAPAAAAVVQRVAALLGAAGHAVGTASAQGVMIAGQAVLRGDATDPAGCRMVLDDPDSTAAVLEVSDLAIAAEGLGFDRADVAAVMAPPQSAVAASLLLQSTAELAVLSAEQPEVAALAEASRARRLAWVARDPRAGPLAAHAAAGGQAVFLDAAGGGVCLSDDGRRHEVAPPPAEEDALPLLFAVAIAYGLGLEPEAIAHSLAQPPKRAVSQQEGSPHPR